MPSLSRLPRPWLTQLPGEGPAAPEASDPRGLWLSVARFVRSGRIGSEQLSRRGTRWWLAAGILAAAGFAAERPWVLPPVDGEASGGFTPLLLPGAPPVQWKLTVSSARPRERDATVEIAGPGLKLAARAVLDPRGEGTWIVDSGTVDLGEWYGWLVPRVAPAAGATSLSGTLAVRGAGTWRAGELGGRVELSLRDGRYEDSARKLTIEGLAAELRIGDLISRRTEGEQEVTWTGGRYDTVPFGAGRVAFQFDGRSVRVHSARLAVLGGEIETGELTVSTETADVAVTARVRGLDLGRMLFLLPPVLAAAQGRLDGSLELQRGAAGIQIGVGRLSLRRGESAELRLAPTPGLLSTQLPPSVRQHYPGLVQLETGGIPLKADVLEVTLTPAGDPDGRTAAVRIEGGPVDPNLRAPVVLQVNVRGPLDSLVKFGTDSRLRFGDGR